MYMLLIIRRIRIFFGRSIFYIVIHIKFSKTLIFGEERSFFFFFYQIFLENIEWSRKRFSRLLKFFFLRLSIFYSYFAGSNI